MKTRLFLGTILGLAACLGSSSAQEHLEGCPDPDVIAKSLARIRESNWRDVSLARLRSIWPTELEGLNCDAEVCSSVRSEDRVIKGHCVCCATFAFNIQRNPERPRREELGEIIINYSAFGREQLVAAAKKFASASGLKGAELATVGRDSVQNFHWQTTRGNDRELSGIEIRFTRQGTLWELYFNFGRNIIEPPAPQ